MNDERIATQRKLNRGTEAGIINKLFKVLTMTRVRQISDVKFQISNFPAYVNFSVLLLMALSLIIND